LRFTLSRNISAPLLAGFCLLYGSVYIPEAVPDSGGAGERVNAADEKAYRQGLPAGAFPRRTGLLARNPAHEKDNAAEPFTGYFDAYRNVIRDWS
jgi:hypothetical protein